MYGKINSWTERQITLTQPRLAEAYRACFSLGVKLVRHSDPSAFQRAALPFLVENEAVHCVFIGIIDILVRDPSLYTSYYLWTIEVGARIVGAAWMTPPHALGLSLMPKSATALLIEEALRLPSPLNGVTGPADIAGAFHDEWILRGGALQSEVKMRLYSATRAIPPTAVPGTMRAVEARDLDLLVRWNLAFCQECDLTTEAGQARREAEFAIQSGDRYLWEDGEAVAMVGVSGRTPSGIRINFVYTPDEKRGKGYASALVATVTSKQLASGKKRCFLFTDLANPTSNSIYQKVGYRPLCDFGQYNYRPAP